MSSKSAPPKGPAPVAFGVAPAMGAGDGGNAPIPIIKFDDDKDGLRERKLAVRKQDNRLNITSSGRSKPATSKKNVAKSGFFAWLTSLAFKAGVVYLLVAAFWSCPSSLGKVDYKSNDQRATCRSFAHAKTNLSPIITPYVHAAQAKVEPHIKPYTDATAPYLRSAYKTALPYYKSARLLSKRYYNRNIEPLRKRSIKQAHTYADPHLRKAQKHYSTHLEPHLVNIRKAAKPYQDIYRRDVAPVLNDAYLQSIAAGAGSYRAYVKHVHPRVISSAQQSHAFYVNHVDPTVRRVYALYVVPSANKALQKVFDWKAHALGSDAISKAKQWSKLAKKDAKEAGVEKIAEARDSAARAVQDPSLADRLNIAKDQVRGGPLAAADPVASAVSDAEDEAELISVKEQLEAWEKGLAGLIDDERQLIKKRFEEIHSRFEDSVPDRFNVLTEDVELEVDGVFAQLQKSFEKVKKQEESTQRVDAGEALIRRQHDKLMRSRDRAVSTLGALLGELEAEEISTQTASVEEVKRYIAEALKAHKAVLHSAKSPRTRREFATWDEDIAPRAEHFSAEIDDLKKGSQQLTRGIVGLSGGQKDSIQWRIGKLQQSLESMYDTARAELGAFGAQELAAIGGHSAATNVLESIVDSSKQLTQDAQQVLQDAAHSLGDTGSGAVSLLSSRASEASASASSIAREGAKIVGIRVDPETPGEYFESAVEAGKTLLTGSATTSPLASSASSVGSELFSSASSIARQAAQRAGVHFEPETNGEYIESIVSEISSSASDAAQSISSVVASVGNGLPVDASYYSSVGSAASADVSSSAAALGSSASSLAREAAKSLGVPVQPETPGEYVESVASVATNAADSLVGAVGSAAHQASRSLASVVGAEATPEGVGEYVENAVDGVKSAMDGVVSGVSSAYTRRGRVVSSASSSVAEVGSSAASLVADASASVSSLARRGRVVVGSSASAGGGLGSVASEASSYLSSLGSEADDVVHQATRSVSSALGVEPTPETASEYLEAAGNLAEDVLSSASSVGSVASASGASVVDEVAKSVESLVERVREEL